MSFIGTSLCLPAVYRRPKGLQSVAELTNTGCIFCDGVDQYATSAFDPSTVGAGDISVELWFKPHHLETANSHHLFMLGDTTNGLAIQKIGSSSTYRLMYYKGGSGSNATLGSTPTELEHHQIVLTRTGTTIEIYLDGVSVYSATSSSFDMDLNAGCTIGANATPAGYWKGHLDVFRIWSSILTSTEVTTLYNSRKPSVASVNAIDYNSSGSLVSENLFEELTGTTVADQTGNGNTITLVNTPTWNQDAANFTTPSYAATHALQLDGVQDFALPFTDYNLAIGTGEFTAYIRCSFNDVTASQVPFVSGEIGGSDNFFDFLNIASKTRGAVRGSGGATQYVDSTASSVNDTYYDLTLTRKVNASNGTIEFFVDGVSQGTTTSTYLDDLIDRDAYIGKYLSGSLPFGGKIREIAVWDEVLTDAEILAITSLGDHDLRVDSGNYASQANLLNFLVAINLTGSMIDLKGTGSAVHQVGPEYVSYP